MVNEYEFTVESDQFGTLTCKVLSIGEKARLQTKARSFDPLDPQNPQEPSMIAHVLAELDTALVGGDLDVAGIVDEDSFWNLWGAYVTARDTFRENTGKNAIKPSTRSR